MYAYSYISIYVHPGLKILNIHLLGTSSNPFYRSVVRVGPSGFHKALRVFDRLTVEIRSFPLTPNNKNLLEL